MLPEVGKIMFLWWPWLQNDICIQNKYRFLWNLPRFIIWMNMHWWVDIHLAINTFKKG